MHTLYLLRHGKTNAPENIYYGSTEYGLTIEGKAQIEALKSQISLSDIQSIYTSPMKRTLQTVEIINQVLQKPVIKEPLLAERKFGIFENLQYHEIQDKYPTEYEKWMKDWYGYPVPEGESAKQAYERIKQFIPTLKMADQDILVVTHLGCIRTLLADMLGFQEEDSWRFRITHGKMTKIIFNDEGYSYLDI